MAENPNTNPNTNLSSNTTPQPQSTSSILGRIITGTFCVGIVLLLLYAVTLSYQFIVQPESYVEDPKYVSTVNYQIGGEMPVSATLPARIADVEPHTPVTVTATLAPTNNSSIRIETIYTALRMYVDDEIIYEVGMPGSYPQYLIDPPTIITLVPLPDSKTTSQLRLEYASPGTRDTVDLPALEYGKEAAILKAQFLKYGVSMLASIFFLLIGAVMAIVGAIYTRKTKAAAPFIHLGLLAFAIGAWSLGECPFSALIIPYPAVLYMMAYCSLFLLLPPFLKFLEQTLRPRSLLVFRAIRYTSGAVVLLAFALQVSGLVSLSQNLVTYEMIISAVLLLVLMLAIWELTHNNNPTARRFVIPTMTLIAFALLSFVNYEIRFIDSIIFIFQVGGFIFIFQLAWIGVRYFEEAAEALAQSGKLKLDIENMNHQLYMQRRQNERLVESAEKVKAMRHDLRHQLTVLSNYNDAGDLKGMRHYIDEISDTLPTTVTECYCENYAVNAVIGYYIAMAESEGMPTDTKFEIPEATGKILAVDICVIVGNLLENAIFALRNLEQGEQGEPDAQGEPGDKYIKARAKTVNNTLSIIVENSYDGIWEMNADIFISRKTEDDIRNGIGLASVKAVCEKYNGLLQIETESKTWRVSILINGIEE